MASLETTRGRRNGAARTVINARGALKSRADDVLDDFSELRKDVSLLVDAASKAAKAEAKDASKHIRALSGDLRARASEGASRVTEQVRARPAAALGISLGAGVLLGMLLARR